MKRNLLLASLLSVFILSSAFAFGDGVQKYKISVQPVFYVPKDGSVYDAEAYGMATLAVRHLKRIQELYKTLLVTDTFSLSSKKPMIIQSQNYTAAELFSGSDADKDLVFARIAGDLLDQTGQDRQTCSQVFVVLFVRPAKFPMKQPVAGKAGQDDPAHWAPPVSGGRTFNGAPGSGGGLVVMEFQSLFLDDPEPFQSSLVRNLAAAFAFPDPSALGYDPAATNWLRSSNAVQKSHNFNLNFGMYKLSPEEAAAAAKDWQIFPDFEYVTVTKNPDKKITEPVNGYQKPLNIPGK